MNMVCHARLFLSRPPGRLLVALFLGWLAVVPPALGQDPVHPLKPLDLSSPRATLKTFLEAGDAIGDFLARGYLPDPSKANFERLVPLGGKCVKCLDLSEVPEASRLKTAGAAATSLYEALSRIGLPDLETIPDAAMAGDSGRWVIPNTEIAIERLKTGPHSGEYLFSRDTVARAGEFYERVRGLPYTREVPLVNVHDTLLNGGGWMIPVKWIGALPAWFRLPFAGEAVWKWMALLFLLGSMLLLMRPVYRLSRWSRPERPFMQALARLSLPVFFLLATPLVTYLTLAQINFIGDIASFIALLATATWFVSGAWIAWRIAPVIAEAIIASPNIASESIDAHLIRTCTRLLGIVAGAGLLAMGADRLGLPVYGIIAGLGVGGIAIALAAQPTVENLLGGLSLFADKPIRVGDLCRYGTDEGTVEAIGIRSTRIRGRDRTLTTIPNAVLSKMSLVSLAHRDRMLIQSVIGVRYETSLEQLRYLLVKLRETLMGDPNIDPELVRVRFVGFGASSLDLELFAYVKTRVWPDFLAVREEVFLRVMDIVNQSGTSFAFPSQTVYFGRDGGLDPKRTEAAEAQMRQWQAEGRLPGVNSPVATDAEPERKTP